MRTYRDLENRIQTLEFLLRKYPGLEEQRKDFYQKFEASIYAVRSMIYAFRQVCQDLRACPLDGLAKDFANDLAAWDQNILNFV